MTFSVYLQLAYAAPPGVSHNVTVNWGSSNWTVSLSTDNPFEQVETTSGPITLTVGRGGCPGPVYATVFADGDAWREQRLVYIGDATFPGTGSVVLNTSMTGLLNYDRGFDYYALLSMPGDYAASTPLRIEGVSMSNYLGTTYASEVIPHPSPGRFIGLNGWWRGAQVMFGLNESDLAALPMLRIVGANPMFRPDETPARIKLSISKGFRTPAISVANERWPSSTTWDGESGYVISPNWSILPDAFPVPNQSGPPPSRRNNTLVKRVDTTFIPGSPGVPAFAGQPALPARTVTVSEQVCTWGPDYATMARLGWTYDRDLAAKQGGAYGPTAGWLPPGINTTTRTGTNWAGYSYNPANGWEIPYATTCQIVNRQVTLPAQPFIPPSPAIPPVPAQTIRDFHIGWTGRARSIRTFRGNGRVRFKAPAQLSAAVVGLNSEFRTTGYSDIRFAFRLENRVARIIDQGGTETYIGPYNDGDTFEIQRLDRQITYRINGTAVRTIPNSGSPLHLDAIMFTGGDSIYDPEMQELTSGHTSLTPLASNGGGIQFTPPVNTLDTTTAASLQALTSLGWGSVRPGASGVANLRPLVVFSRPAHRSEGSLQPIFGLAGDRPYAASAVALSVLTSEGEGGLGAPSYAVSNGIVTFVTGNGMMQTGGLLSGEGSLSPLLTQGSDRPYGAGTGALMPLNGVGSLRSAQEMLDANVMDFVLAGAGVEMFGELAVVINSTGHVTGLISYVGIVNAAAMTSAQANTSYVLSALLSANAITNVAANSIDAFTQQGDTVWVVNTTTGNSTRYEKFGFNSFARIAGKYYGAKEGGVYLLEGDTDDGADIASMIAVGKQNFGTTNRSAQMRLENCYMAVASDGRLVLKVRAEGREYIYRTRSSSTELQTQRVDIGRGIRANFMEFEIWNENGDDFDIQTLEFAAVVLSRRI